MLEVSSRNPVPVRKGSRQLCTWRDPSVDVRAKVLCITGSGRSGSTLLACLLREIDGFFAVSFVAYGMGHTAKRIVILITAPFLLKYGYPL